MLNSLLLIFMMLLGGLSVFLLVKLDETTTLVLVGIIVFGITVVQTILVFCLKPKQDDNYEEELGSVPYAQFNWRDHIIGEPVPPSEVDERPVMFRHIPVEPTPMYQVDFGPVCPGLGVVTAPMEWLEGYLLEIREVRSVSECMDILAPCRTLNISRADFARKLPTFSTILHILTRCRADTLHIINDLLLDDETIVSYARKKYRSTMHDTYRLVRYARLPLRKRMNLFRSMFTLFWSYHIMPAGVFSLIFFRRMHPQLSDLGLWVAVGATVIFTIMFWLIMDICSRRSKALNMVRKAKRNYPTFQ